MKQTHRSLISALVLAGLLTPALMLSGCDGGGSTAASATAQAAKANVGISIEFPAAGASAARIDDNASAVLVEVWDATNQYCQDYGCYGEPTKSVTLERPAGGGTVSASLLGVSPGEAVVRVTQLSGSGEDRTALETVNVSANLTEGQNNMTVTLIRAAWTLQTPVTFNKIVSTDTTRIDSFSLVPYAYGYQAEAAATGNVDVYGALSFQQTLMRGTSFYGTVLKGSNLCSYDTDDYGGYGGYGGTITCGQSQLVSSNYYRESGLAYFNRIDSASSSENFALLSGSGDTPLANDGQDRERGWIAFSVGPDGTILELAENNPFPDETASDPAVWNDFKIAVTGGSTIQGNFIEWLTKSVSTSNRKCYSDYEFTTEITCPAQATAARAAAKHGKTFRTALAKKLNALNAGPAKAAADANGCYNNLEISYKNWDSGYDSATQTSWYYVEDETEVSDVCRHPFTATATQLQSTDVDLVNQAQAVRAKTAKR